MEIVQNIKNSLIEATDGVDNPTDLWRNIAKVYLDLLRDKFMIKATYIGVIPSVPPVTSLAVSASFKFIITPTEYLYLASFIQNLGLAGGIAPYKAMATYMQSLIVSPVSSPTETEPIILTTTAPIVMRSTMPDFQPVLSYDLNMSMIASAILASITTASAMVPVIQANGADLSVGSITVVVGLI